MQASASPGKRDSKSTSTSHSRDPLAVVSATPARCRGMPNSSTRMEDIFEVGSRRSEVGRQRAEGRRQIRVHRALSIFIVYDARLVVLVVFVLRVSCVEQSFPPAKLSD